MAVITVGRGITPVTGTREFDPIPCAAGVPGASGITFGGGDADDFVITSTGVGNQVQGEEFLQFDGNTLLLEGDLYIDTGTITATGISSGVTTNILSYDTGTGAITYNASGGGTTNFLRADGTWGVPVGTYTHPNHTGHVTSTGDGATVLTVAAITGQSAMTSGLISTDELLVNNGGVIQRMDISVLETYMQSNLSFGTITSVTAGNGMDFPNITSTGSVILGTPGSLSPSTTSSVSTTSHTHAIIGFAEITGTPVNNQVAVWTDSTTIEGDSGLTWDGSALTISSSTNSLFRLIQSDAGGTPGTPEGGWNYIAFYDGDLDRQGYMGVDGTGDIQIASEVTGGVIELRNDTFVTGDVDISGLTGTGNRLIYATAAGLLTAGNLTGHITTTNSLTTALHISAITDQAALGSGLLSTDELLVNDGGSLARMDISVLQAYMQTNLAFSATTGTVTQVDAGNGMDFTSITTTGSVTLGTPSTDLTPSTTNAVTATSHTHAITGFAEIDGTPVNNQIAVWTGAATLEGESNLTYSSNALNIGVSGTAPHISLSIGATPGWAITSDANAANAYWVYSNTATTTSSDYYWRYGGTKAVPAVAPTDAVVRKDLYYVYDGTSPVLGGEFLFQVDGTIATGDFDTKWTWDLKEGAASATQVLELNPNGLEYSADHSTDQAANDRWLPDKGYVDAAVGAAGGVSASGTPVNNQIAVWVNASTIEGDSNFTWDGSELNITGNIELTSTVNFNDVNTQIWEDGSGNLTFKDALGGTVTLSTLIGGAGGGTVTSIASGAGMNFTTITTTGTITMGTPSTLTPATTNSATGTTHTHEVTGFVDIDGTPGATYLGVWTSATEMEGTNDLIYTASQLTVSGNLRATGLIGTGDRLAYAGSTGIISAGNLTGQVTTTNSLATSLTASAITAQTAIGAALVSTDELLVSDGGLLRRMDVSVLETYMQNELAFNLYVHPNHSGQVTSTADGATVVTVSAITAQTALTTGLVSTDELLISDAGVIKRMDVSVLEAYMQANLTFSTVVDHGALTGLGDDDHSHYYNAARLSVWTGSSAITTVGTIGSGIWQGGVIQDAYVANDITLTNITQVTNRSHTNLTDIGTNTHAQIDSHIGSTANPHSVTIAQVASLGTGGQVPYMNGTTDFTYNSTFTFDGTALNVDYIEESTVSNGVRFVSSDVIIGSNNTPTAALDVRGGSGVGLYVSSTNNTYGANIYCSGSGNVLELNGYSGTGTDSRWILEMDVLSPAGGVGLSNGIRFNLDNAISVPEQGGGLRVAWTGVSAGAEEAQMIFGVMTSGSYGEIMTLDTDGLTIDSALTLLTGATVDTIETTLTNDDTHIPTSGAVYDAIAAATVYTFDSGLTESGGNVDLGGALSTNATFTAASTYDMSVGTLASPLNDFYVYADNVVRLQSNLTGQTSYLEMDAYATPRVLLYYDDGVALKGFGISSTAFVVADEQDNVGMIYVGDYSTLGTANDRWIPDYAAVKAYADGVVTGYVDTTGTPANNQIAVFTDADTIEGDSDFTWTGAGIVLDNMDTSFAISINAYNYSYERVSTYSNTSSSDHRITYFRYGSSSSTSAPSNAELGRYTYYVHDGVDVWNSGAEQKVTVSGAIASNDFETYWSWMARAGTTSLPTAYLYSDGYRYYTDFSSAMGSTDRWIPDRGYVATHLGGQDLDSSVTSPGVGEDGQVVAWNNTGSYFEMITASGAGTVTSVVAGNGMNFTTITAAGSVTMGTPTTLTLSTTNAVTTTSHTHALSIADVSSGASGLAPAHGGVGATYYLNAAGTWTVPAGVSSPWSKSGTNLSPTTGGDDILLATGGVERIMWGDGDAGIYESSDDVLDVLTNGSSNWQWTTVSNITFKDLLPTSNKSLDLGNATFFFDNAYIDTLYLDTGSIYIDVSGTDMIFTDGSNTDVTLSSLVSGGGASIVGTPASGQVTVWDSATGIEGFSNLAFVSGANSSLTIDGSSSSAIIGGAAQSFYIRPGAAGYIGIGSTTYSSTFVTVQDSNSTPLTNAFQIYSNQGGGSTREFYVSNTSGGVYFTNLSSDDTEDHVVAIDDSSGLLTKRSVASLANLSFTADTGTTYTFVLTDASKVVTLSDASAITCTVPPNSSVAFPVGTQITVVQIGAGQVTLSPGSGVTLSSADGDLKLRAQYSSATLIKNATDAWYVVGDLTA